MSVLARTAVSDAGALSISDFGRTVSDFGARRVSDLGGRTVFDCAGIARGTGAMHASAMRIWNSRRERRAAQSVAATVRLEYGIPVTYRRYYPAEAISVVLEGQDGGECEP